MAPSDHQNERQRNVPTMTKMLDEAIKKVRELPDSAQDEAAEILFSVAAKQGGPIRIDDDTRAAIQEGMAQARRGEFVNDEDMAAFFERPLALSSPAAILRDAVLRTAPQDEGLLCFTLFRVSGLKLRLGKSPRVAAVGRSNRALPTPQYVARPPEMSNTAPVVKAQSCEAQKATRSAISSTLTKRPRGIFESM
jgi:predicted transcriptional regulator